MIDIREADLSPEIMEKLTGFSVDWENENSCHGYRKNTKSDIENNRVFLAEEGGKTVGYLFGHIERS